MEFHLVSHTHWDREWYRTAEEFRQRLVDLVDELIADPPRDGEAFLLDGQAIILEDYLAVRPSQRDRLRGLLQAGRLEAGPWYVLADELIPSGEALVRNLLAGRQALESLGAASPPVLYCPDSFGHPAALPELAVGFGLPLIILWRGHGSRRSATGDAFRWRSPSGKEVIAFHLPPDGYEFGSSLPVLPEEADSRWTRMREVLARRATMGISLIQNGADHHARQLHLREAIDALTKRAAAGGDRVLVSSLRAFAERLVSHASSHSLRAVSGELRDSYGYTWTLQGTFGTRAAQKRANAIAERTLRRAEAWCAAARLSGAPSRMDHLRAAWRTLLEAHPHDTLCGTSIDPVADAMDLRLSSARHQGVALIKKGIESMAGHDAAGSREPRATLRDLVVIVNGAPCARGGVVIVREIDKLADEPVGPGSADGPREADIIAMKPLEGTMTLGHQLMATRVGRSRIESERHYPDNDIVRERLVARYVSALPGLSVRAADADEVAQPAAPVSVAENQLSCGSLRVKCDRRGAVSLSVGDVALGDLLLFEDRSDRGDLYTPSIGRVVAWPKFIGRGRVHSGPLIGELAQEWTFVPERKKGMAQSSLSVGMRVTADSPLLELRVRGVNRARNHRLRIGIATGVAGATVIADAAFGPVERKPIVATEEDRRMETPPATAPLQRYVSLYSKTGGVTIHSDGLAEYEVDGEGIVWVTLIRAVGQLSRNDIPERPGHAGWPEPTPKAQSLGPYAARLAVHVHGPKLPATLQAIHCESDRFLNPVRGFTLRASGAELSTAGGIELSGMALAASAIKESEDGRAIVLRCVNLSDRPQAGVWTLSAAVDSAHLARLDETVAQRLDPREQEGRTVIEFAALPRAVTTILATPRLSH